MSCYAFGSNASGQLGIGHKHDVSSPMQCRFSTILHSRPNKIAASGNATIILLENGDILGAGSSVSALEDARSRYRNCSEVFQPIELKSKLAVKLCSATWEASFIVTKSDEIFVCGKGSKGELGLGGVIPYTSTYVMLGTSLPSTVKIVDISSGITHTIVVLSNGDVWGWGNGRKGQLGEPAGILWAPRKIEALNFSVVRGVCGREFTFLVSDPSDGQFVVLGSDSWSVRSQAPSHVKDWKDIGASWGSIFVLGADGRFRSWGRDDHGQLAPYKLPQISSMSLGSEHAVALSQDGQSIYCWGWGEHGNCGKDSDEASNIRSGRNEIILQSHDSSKSIAGVGAGCATSFYWEDIQNTPSAAIE